MKRKIIKQGHNTLTITLPSDWVKRFNLVAGKEIDLIERENGLFITTEKHDQIRRSEFDITEMDIPTIWKYFMAVYREGYDEVKISFPENAKFDSPYKFFTSHAIDMKYGKKMRQHTPFETIQEITNRFIGFEVVEHHEDYCIIKDMGEISAKEFDNSLRRVFLLLQQMGEEILEAIKTNNTKILQHTHDIDINVDKFHDYCIRVLHKTAFKDVKKSDIIFAILHVLELIGDEFKNVAFHLIEDMKGKKLDNLAQLGEKVLEQFNVFYDLYYNFDRAKAIGISNLDQEIYFYLPKLYKKKSGKRCELSDDELEIFNHYRRISKYIISILELRIEMEF